jgi:hypothetical protein
VIEALRNEKLNIKENYNLFLNKFKTLNTYLFDDVRRKFLFTQIPDVREENFCNTLINIKIVET